MKRSMTENWKLTYTIFMKKEIGVHLSSVAIKKKIARRRFDLGQSKGFSVLLGYSEAFNQSRCFSFPLCSPGEINFPTFLVPPPPLPGPFLFSVGLTWSTVAMNPSTSNDSFSRRGSRRPLSRWITRYVKRVLLPVPLTSSSLSFVGRFRTVPDNQRNPIFVQQYHGR